MRLRFCSLLLLSTAAYADPTFQFDIPSKTLDRALKDFAAQTGLQVAYFTKTAEGHTAPAVLESLTAEQALRKLLSTSGLSYERVDDGTFLIRTQQRTTPSTPAPAPTTDTPKEVSEVLVTGSHIRGVENDTIPVTIYDRQYIERSGSANMMQFVESLPLQFKGGTAGSTEVAPFGSASNWGQNLTRGTGFNIHGVGSVSTLTLINGRRIAPSAQGQFVDISTIPLSAVERVEVLTDGASAIYGADAVAGVVNIILRRNFEGFETGLQYGGDTHGSVDEQRISQLTGTTWSSGNLVAVGEYHRRSELDVMQRDFMVEAGAHGPTYLLPRRKLGSFVLDANQDLPGSFDLSGMLLYSYEEVDSADSSGGGSVFLQTPITNKWSAALGVGYEPVSDWRLTLDATSSQVDTATDFNIIGLETGEVFQQVIDYNDTFETWSVDLKGDGTVFEIPGGKVRLAIGGSYREEEVNSTRIRTVPATGFEVRAIDARDVTAVFAELYVPLIGEYQQLPWAKRIEVSLAARRDDYSDFGSTTNPKLGIVWTPMAGLDLRASVSKSFRAPTVAEKALASRGQQLSVSLSESPDGSELVPTILLLGSAPLTAEKSDNTALGFSWRPASLQGFELSLNYFDIEYRDRISAAIFDLGMLSRPDVFGSLITSLPDDAAAQSYIDALVAQDWLYFDDVGTGAEGVRYVIDLRQKNAARSKMSGFDASTSYSFSRGANTFDLSVSVTHLREILTALTDTSTAFDEVDRYNQPLDWRGRAMMTWTRNELSATAALNYADDYINDTFVEDIPIGSWTTVDTTVSYEFAGRTRVSLSVTNLLDQEPPLADSPFFELGYDVYNADPLGRYVTARISTHW